MAIIAILAAVAYPTYTGMRKRAYLAEAKSLAQEIRVDVWATYVEKGKWPAGSDVNTPTLPSPSMWEFVLPASEAAGGVGTTYTFFVKGLVAPVDESGIKFVLTGNGGATLTEVAASDCHF